jgi:3D (Asp-Asp-Asp) domain-containing protein
MKCALRLLTVVLVLSAQIAMARVRLDGTYIMTAYSTRGTTASGEPANRRLVAADPDLLPLGTQIRVTNAGPYSGEYEVGDTGAKIQGRKLDIYIANHAQAKKFGKRRVKVKVLKLAEPAK